MPVPCRPALLEAAVGRGGAEEEDSDEGQTVRQAYV